jgi:Flp pilus assembly protein TadG
MHSNSRRKFDNRDMRTMVSQQQFKGLLTRLRSDASGNALMIGAAAMFPLIGIVGGALDIGRMYAAKTRLQHACDAAVLGGRQAMTGSTWNAESAAVAAQFFNMNYPANKYGTKFPAATAGGIDGITFTPNIDGSITAVAEALVPMTLMRVFGASDSSVKVSCKAQVNLPNTDVMMVLDTTGSMNETNPGDSANRISTMKTAVNAFYNVLDDANSAGATIRYGFVPYSTTVNVGSLLKPEWMVDEWEYQSRQPDGVETVEYAGGASMASDNIDWKKISGSWTSSSSNLPLEACVAPADTTVWGPSTVISQTSTPYPGPPAGTKTVKTIQYSVDGKRYSVNNTGTSCSLLTEVFTNYVEEYKQVTYPVQWDAGTTDQYWWKYKPVSYDVSGLTVGGSITAPIGSNHQPRSITWNGCIEERDTKEIKDKATIPKDAFDLDIDLVPNGDPKTQWRPALPKLVFARNDMNNWETSTVRSPADFTNVGDTESGSYAICPSPARKLATMSSLELSGYLDTLVPAGDTYHDIGMIWGARLLSSTGIFKSENSGGAAKHMIFMTDGETNTNPVNYDAYGWTALDRRRQDDKNIKPEKAKQDKDVEDRFTAMCEATRNKNITVWVIAFGTTLTPMLKDCASAGRSFQANNAAELQTAFSDIATKIANLRLVK